MDYDFRSIEKKWQSRWAAEKTFHAVEDPSKPNIMSWICFRIRPAQVFT